MTALNAEKVYDAYSVQFAIPELPQGDYKAVYSNGFAEDDAGVLTVGVSHEDAWMTKVYDVTKYKVDNTGVKDCTAMVNTLAGHISNTGGGVLYFPQGHYMFTGSLTIPARVTVKGDGYEYSQLFWPDQWYEVVKYEDGYTDRKQTKAITLIEAPDGNIVIEGLDFAGGNTGTLLRCGNGGNVRFENCRVNMNAYVGTEYGWHPNYYTSSLKNQASTGAMMFQLAGSNNKILNSEFMWTGQMELVHINTRVDYLLVQNCVFEHDGPTGGGFFVDGAYRSIIEDCEIDRCTVRCASDNIYMARTSITNATTGDNREAFTTDFGGGITKFHDYLEMGEEGLSFTFPEDIGAEAYMTDAQGRKYLPKLLIMDGTGAGQWRHITGFNGKTVIIDSPFTVAPDATSRFATNIMYVNWYFVDLTVDNGGMFQFYTSQGNSVIDGMKITRAAGIKLYGQQPYNVVGNNWYCSVANCNLSQDNYYHTWGWMDYWQGNRDSKLDTSKRLPGGSFIAAVSVVNSKWPNYNLSCTIHGNTLSNNCLLYLFSCGEGSLVDCVVDSNNSFNTRCGIYIEETPGNLLLNGNTTENVAPPIETFPYDESQWRAQFE